MTNLQELLTAIATDLGDPAHWAAPVEFWDSLALCSLNSAYSLQATSTSVKRVLARYRAVRPSADTDSGPDLIQAMNDAGGPEVFAHDVLRNRTELPGTSRLRTVGIHEALIRLADRDVGVTTAAELRAVVDDGNNAAEKAWCSVLGLGAQSWSYLLMNAGVVTEVKPDVKVQRYLTRVLEPDHHLSPLQIRQLVVLAAASLEVEPRALDRAIWLHESPTSK